MDRHELARAVRKAYRRAMKARRTDKDAISDCVAAVRQHGPQVDDPEDPKVDRVVDC
jgi:hypothetical protein